MIFGINLSRYFGVSVALLLCYGVTSAAYADDGWGRPITGVREFADVRSQLQVLVNINGFNKINHFCVIGGTDTEGPFAEVYWSTEHQIILWEPTDNDYALLMSRDDLDLTQDVVANLNDVNGSTYLVTRKWVNNLLDDCRRRGNIYTVQKTEDSWTSIKEYKDFLNVKDQLQTLVNVQGHHKINQICIIGQKAPEYVGAYIYWPIEHRLIYWLPNRHDLYDPEELLVDYGDLDLEKGLRNKEDSKSHMIYEMPRSYVKKIINACALSGEEFVILKSKQ